MSEETKAPVEGEVKKDDVQTSSVVKDNPDASISDKEMGTINKEIDKTDADKLEQAKKDGVEEGGSAAVQALEKQLAEIKESNEAIRKTQEEEAKKADLQAEISKEKDFASQVNQKRLVPPSENPTKPTEQTSESIEDVKDVPIYMVGKQMAGKAATLTKEEVMKR